MTEQLTISKLSRAVVIRDVIRQIDTGVANWDAHYLPVMQQIGLTRRQIEKALWVRSTSLVFGPMATAFVSSVVLDVTDWNNANAEYEARAAAAVAMLLQWAVLFCLRQSRRPLGGIKSAIVGSMITPVTATLVFIAIQHFIGPTWWLVGAAKLALGAVGFASITGMALARHLSRDTTQPRSAIAKNEAPESAS